MSGATFLFLGEQGETMGVPEDVEKIAKPVLEQAGVELVHVAYQREPQGWTLRFYLDKEGGIGLQDCQDWSDRLGQLVEEHGLVGHAYSLEVSSPGMDRPLRKASDFQKFMGLEAVIKLYAPLNNQKNYHGKMLSLENDVLSVFDRTSGLVRLPLASIASAKLDAPIEF